MNLQDSYDVISGGSAFQKELNWVFTKTGSQPSEALFIPYAYKDTNYTQFFNELSAIFSNEGIKLKDISSGNPAVLIPAAKFIVVGGGDISTFMAKMKSLITPTFNPFDAIKSRVSNGIPYLGWNQGASVISPKYFTPPSSTTLTGINASSPFQIVCDYQDTPQNRTSIFNFLQANNTLKTLICQIPKVDGSSVRLEDSGAGMINSATEPFPQVINFEIVGGVLNAS